MYNLLTLLATPFLLAFIFALSPLVFFILAHFYIILIPIATAASFVCIPKEMVDEEETP